MRKTSILVSIRMSVEISPAKSLFSIPERRVMNCPITEVNSMSYKTIPTLMRKHHFKLLSKTSNYHKLRALLDGACKHINYGKMYKLFVEKVEQM